MIYSLTDTLPSSEVTVTETNLVSTQPKTSTWTKPPSTTPSEISTSDVLLIDTVKSSQLTVTETKPVSSQPTASKGTESTSTTVMLEISTSNALKLTASWQFWIHYIKSKKHPDC